MQLLIDALSMAMSGTLLWAGLEKSRNMEGIATTIRDLGIGMPAFVLGIFLAAAEIALALALIFAPASASVHLAVVLLALLFAAGGAWAMATGRRVRCSCFGSMGNTNLGIAQLWALVAWLSAVVVLHFQSPRPVPAEEGFVNLAIVTLVLAGIRAFGIVRAQHSARGDRRSAMEMLVWLR